MSFCIENQWRVIDKGLFVLLILILSMHKGDSRNVTKASHDSVIMHDGKGDIQKEANELYEKHIREYAMSTEEESLTTICEPWEMLGCKCSGSVEEVTLVCRGLNLQEIPSALPQELIKL